MEFLDDYKINKKVQSKKRVTKSRKLREDGEKMLQELALTEEDIENIFDILEEDLPELWKNVPENVLYMMFPVLKVTADFI